MDIIFQTRDILFSEYNFKTTRLSKIIKQNFALKTVIIFAATSLKLRRIRHGISLIENE